MLHHGGMWKEEVSERVFVASTMQCTRVSRLERCCWRDVASRRHVKGTGWRRVFVASTMQHTKISRLEMFLERCCITVECGRKMLASECLLHQGGMRKEEVTSGKTRSADL